MQYLFAGMLQERNKLKSWSCAISGVEKGRPFDMKLLVKGECVRFSRKQHVPGYDGEWPPPHRRKKGESVKVKVVHIPERDEIVHVCDNQQMLVYWNQSDNKCVTHKSTPSQRELLRLWDPRTACLIPDREGTDYQKALNRRLEFWRKSFAIERNDALWTCTFTKTDEYQISRLLITVDTEHGFTPVRYFGDVTYKPNSRFPGRVDVDYEGTAKWEQIDGVWVPIRHRYVRGDGKVITEYNVSWDWVNKDVDDKEFAIDALGVPGDVPRIYMDERGQEIINESPFEVEKRASLGRANAQ